MMWSIRACSWKWQLQRPPLSALVWPGAVPDGYWKADICKSLIFIIYTVTCEFFGLVIYETKGAQMNGLLRIVTVTHQSMMNTRDGHRSKKILAATYMKEYDVKSTWKL